MYIHAVKAQIVSSLVSRVRVFSMGERPSNVVTNKTDTFNVLVPVTINLKFGDTDTMMLVRRIDLRQIDVPVIEAR